MSKLRPGDVWIRVAAEAEAGAITDCVQRAFGHYEKRLGQLPGPMLLDYREVIREHDVFVALVDRVIHGVLVLTQTREGFLLDNIAVDPRSQGTGVGRALLAFAEGRAHAAGYDSMYLYTHEKMSENRALYARIGYEEYDRRTEQGLARVYMRKRLQSGTG